MKPTDRNSTMDRLGETYRGKKILITGGLGFIGSNLAIRLVDCGAEVSIIDLGIEGSGANDFNILPVVNDVSIFKSDVADKKKVLPLAGNADFIFNLSGYNNHLESSIHPEKDLYANCTSQLAFLSACTEAATKARVLFTATRTQYGRVTENPVKEETPLHPIDFHGAHKTLAENYHLLYHHHGSLKTVIARVPNVYGPRQPIRPRGISLIASFILPALEDGEIKIFGSGDRAREILYVDDLVEALLALNSTSATEGNCYNVGGFRASLKEIAISVVSACQKGSIRYGPFPAEVQRIEVGEVQLDSTKIEIACGWRASTTPSDGLRKTMEFFEQNREKYLPV